MTISQHLNRLPEPYKTQALKNTNKDYLEDNDNGKDAPQILRQAFYWEISPEGHDYWNQFHEALNEGRVTLS